MKYIIPLIYIFAVGCSLRGESVYQELKTLREKRDRYNFDEAYVLGTKNLRDRNKDSLLAHVAYISARQASKAMLAEYKALAKENKGPFYEYLVLRSELTTVSYRDMAARSELTEKMEKLALANEGLKESALYDLCSDYYLLRDKKKKREYVEMLLAKKPKAKRYRKLMAQVLEPNNEAKDIIKYCQEGIKGSSFDLGFCSNLNDLNNENAKGLLEKRNELLRLMVDKSLQKRHEASRSTVWNMLNDLAEEENGEIQGLKKEFSTKVLAQNSKWIPREVYRKYYGDIDYDDFEFILKIGRINKEIDFKKRVELFEALLDPKPSKKRQAMVYSSLGYAYLNPANDNKEKAFKYLIQANEYDPLSSYGTTMLLDLILELKKDSDIGLLIVEDRLESTNEENAKMNLESSTSVDNFLNYSKGELSSLHAYRGQFYLKKKQVDKARLSFLESYQIEESELNAYFLGELYAETNPMVAIDFLGHSLKKRSVKSPMKEGYSQKRNQLLKKLHSKYFSKKFEEKDLLAEYEEKADDNSSKEHMFLGKPLVTEKIADFNGGDYDWSTLKGKKVIISFWATWCTPCFQEMAVLNKIQKEGKIKDLKIVGVCTDGLAQKKKVRKILKNGDIKFDILLDDGTFKNKYLVAAIPSMFFLNEKGSFIKQKTGYSPELEKEILKLFK